MGHFVMRQVPSGMKFDLLAGNGQVIATSEVYRTAAACRKGMESVRKYASSAGIEDSETQDLQAHPKFRIFRDKAGEYRFRLTSRNGRVIAASGGYSTKAACLAGIESVRLNAAE